jgi:hypothetical protein
MKHRSPPDAKGAMQSAKARARVPADDRVRHPLKSFPAFALCCRDLAIGVLIRRDACSDGKFEVNRRAIAASATVWSYINISSESHKGIAWDVHFEWHACDADNISNFRKDFVVVDNVALFAPRNIV